MQRMTGRAWIVCALALLLAVPGAMADVTPGDVVSKANWEQVEGLVPDFIVDQVKAGRVELKIGALDYDPGSFQLPGIAKSLETNSGRYGVDDAGNLIEAATGKKYPTDLRAGGIPFPELAANDAKLGWKLMYNYFYQANVALGHQDMAAKQLTIGAGGIEQTCKLEGRTFIPAPDDGKYEWLMLAVYRAPYDISGIATLCKQPIVPDVGTVRYTYMPSTRKTRRMPSTTASSEHYFGQESTEDDQCWGGPFFKVRNAEYKLKGVREMLVPFLDEKARSVEMLEGGGVDVNIGANQPLALGFETEGWAGAPWAMTNIVWVKRKVYEIEYTPRDDSDYLFGSGVGWVDAETFNPVYKYTTQASDGKFSTETVFVSQGYQTIDHTIRLMTVPMFLTVNPQRDRATTYSRSARKGEFHKMLLSDKQVKKQEFSKSGFVRYCR
ncbi:DUF1329 domain-containing protein [Desulfoluna sp.]|uniref:DUF1329 domain-containing protein n=1 Tax=Desulfoluna sp. TaxID=2045199 RepID=UPI00261DC4E0|nr:DUF1329 domain-containing protein [Desulfoluna sp.]